jgi:signal recognition particle subunit SRP19
MPGKKDTVVIWPIYFDSSRSRSEGRMVSASEAVISPTIDQVITAALKAGYKPEIERDKKHPSTWYESAGRVLIPKKEPKSAILKKVARAMKGKKGT